METDTKQQLQGETLPQALGSARLFALKPPSFLTVVAALILLAALGLRLLFSYPTPGYPPGSDSDVVLPGMCGINVLHGSHPIMFPGASRLGAQSCYVAAGTFWLFGVSRQTLAVPVILYSFLFVCFMYLYLREAFGSRFSIPGLLVTAIPPAMILINPYEGWSYGETLMYGACSLWLATLLERRRPRRYCFFAFGLSAGLALWCSMVTLMITLPVVIWLLLRRVLNSPSKIILAAAGALAGSSPVWIFLARGGGQEISGDRLTHSASTLTQVFSNISYLIFTQVPELLADKAPGAFTPSSRIILLIYAAALLLFILLAAWPESPVRKQPALLSQAMLVGLILLCCAGIYVLSGAGSIRGWTSRYILPVYFAVPPLASILFAALEGGWRVLQAAGIAFLVLINATDTFGSPSVSLLHPAHGALQASAAADEPLIQWLKKNEIQAVIGAYWDVYYLNFDSKGTILGIPAESEFDYLSVAAKIGNRQLRWAIIDRSSTHLTAWQHRLDLPGDIFPVGMGRYLFVPDTNPPPGDPKNFLVLARFLDPH